MSDILIRGLEPAAVARLDELAKQEGISRNALIAKLLSDATRVPVPMNRDETLRVLDLVSDLGDPEVMARAWR
jgi:hypothetical protein